MRAPPGFPEYRSVLSWGYPTSYASIGGGWTDRLLDIVKGPVQAMQDFVLIAGTATRNVFRSPHYPDDIALQMDSIGVGSLPVVILTGFFTGAVMAMQLARALTMYGATDQVPPVLCITMVRELGPVLTALMVSGRNASGI